MQSDSIPSRERRHWLGLALLALSARAPAAATRGPYRIGFVSPTSPGPTLAALRQGLADAGYVEGRNLVIEARFAEGRAERLPALVAEVLHAKVDVLVVGATAGALAAKRATTSVPIVVAGIIDPVAPGIVASLAYPGGNITGTTFGIAGESYAGKWVELFREAAPKVTRIAALWNSTSPVSATVVQAVRAAALSLKVQLDLLDAAGTPASLEATLATVRGSRAGGLIVTNDPFLYVSRGRIVEFALGERLPGMYFSREFVDAGGLLSYGPSLADSYRRAARHVDRILKGVEPSDLPVDQPTRFETIINMKTARSLGLKMPQSLLLRADETIG